MASIPKKAFRLARSRFRRLTDSVYGFAAKSKPIQVNLFIIGAQKAGTRSLYQYLTEHRNVVGGRVKEIDYFRRPGLYAKGDGWYHSRFAPALSRLFSQTTFYLDASPGYVRDPAALERLFRYNPEAKLLLILREPVSRAYSAWNMYRQHNKYTPEERRQLIEKYLSGFGKERIQAFKEKVFADPFPDFEDMAQRDLNIVQQGEYSDWNGIVRAGLYAEQLQVVLDYFERDHLFITDSQSLRFDTAQVLSRIHHFLGISASEERGDGGFKEHHTRSYPKEMNEGTETMLKNFYRPHNEKLYALIEQRYDWH